MVDNEYIKKAEEELEYLSGDEEARRLAFLREKAIRDEISAIETGRLRGIEEGMKRGMLEGIEEGMKKGKQKGIEEGRKKEKMENAKKMLEKNIEISIISEVTGLTEEEIEKLK